MTYMVQEFYSNRDEWYDFGCEWQSLVEVLNLLTKLRLERKYIKYRLVRRVIDETVLPY